MAMATLRREIARLDAIARTAHPDAGGDRDAWDRLAAAYERAKGRRL